jgi:hypothetical protein
MCTGRGLLPVSLVLTSVAKGSAAPAGAGAWNLASGRSNLGFIGDI